MRVVIRVDASLKMGTGHVMRCLTLAEVLKENEADVEFICRKHEGNLINKLQPEIIYTHHIGDLNLDHQITHKVVMTACRPQPSFCGKEIYAFEVLSSTEWQTPGHMIFSPNVFVDISKQIKIKQDALACYAKEMHKAPHGRSAENSIRLASLRGNSVGVNYAEAFISIREIR
jgi:LmbE family N-acetylglucosaminyl deacetylase